MKEHQKPTEDARTIEYSSYDQKYMYRRLLDRRAPSDWREEAYKKARWEFGTKLLDLLDTFPDPVSISYDETIEIWERNPDLDMLTISFKVWAPVVLPLHIVSAIDYGTITSKFEKLPGKENYMNSNIRDAVIALVASALAAYLGMSDAVAGPVAVWLVNFILGLFVGGAGVAAFLRYRNK